jgi:hypothetical protein
MLLASLILAADLSLSLIDSTAHLFTYPSACISTCHFYVRFKLFWVCWKQAVQGSYAAFIALHRAMLQQNKYETFYILHDPIPRYSSVIQQTIPFQNCNETVSNLSDGSMQICCCILWFTGFITTGCIGPTGLSLSQLLSLDHPDSRQQTECCDGFSLSE